MPKPTSMLKTGPAKHAVMAILPRPFLAIVMLAPKSPMEVPTARTVSPITELGILQMTPIKVNRSTKLSAISSSHVAAMTKP
mmetsp:Transcript_8251/g.10167  ORF Transcript_8251/g.10167 Transcript_8251/m.10167 type:complete len:82 (-) Transcript_8251:1346-1591(-)